MNREEIQKLLGGYATGTLTPEEQQSLFAAALEDQELFDVLGKEQALHDLLRDPAAKAELLAALDAPAERAGWWAWLRRPMVAGVAIAGVAAISAVAVWQAALLHPVAPARAVVAELKAPEMKVLDSPAAEKAPEVARSVPAKRKAEPSALRDAGDEKRQQSLKEESLKKESAPAASLTAPATPPAPTPAPAIAELPTSQAVQVTADLPQFSAVQGKNVQAKNTQQNIRLDARSLFYGTSLLRGENAFVAPQAAGSAGAQQSQAAPKARAVGGSIAKDASAATSLGVRVSLLRGDEEAAVTTPLNAGESVRLKLIPNEDGFLYVAAFDGAVWKMLAGGPAQRLKPFETPPLSFAGSGQKQLYVMLSRQAQTLAPQTLAAMARTNLVETVAELDRATYVVANLQNGAPQQVVQSITLTYR